MVDFTRKSRMTLLVLVRENNCPSPLPHQGNYSNYTGKTDSPIENSWVRNLEVKQNSLPCRISGILLPEKCLSWKRKRNRGKECLGLSSLLSWVIWEIASCNLSQQLFKLKDFLLDIKKVGFLFLNQPLKKWKHAFSHVQTPLGEVKSDSWMHTCPVCVCKFLPDQCLWLAHLR